jgi:lipopolysaccharide biosynthesis protein
MTELIWDGKYDKNGKRSAAIIFSGNMLEQLAT